MISNSRCFTTKLVKQHCLMISQEKNAKPPKANMERYNFIYDPLQEEINFLHDRFQVHQHHSSCVCSSVNWVDLWSPDFKWDQKGTWQGNAQLLPRQTCRPRNREFWKLKARKMVKVQKKNGSVGEKSNFKHDFR